MYRHCHTDGGLYHCASTTSSTKANSKRRRAVISCVLISHSGTDYVLFIMTLLVGSLYTFGCSESESQRNF